MASTRNINTQGDYNAQKKENSRLVNYMSYTGYSVNQEPAYFVRGGNPNYYAGQLSYNPIDIESTLRGIGSTNLEGSSFNATPQYKVMNERELFKVNPIIIPQPYYHSTLERPLYLS